MATQEDGDHPIPDGSETAAVTVQSVTSVEREGKNETQKFKMGADGSKAKPKPKGSPKNTLFNYFKRSPQNAGRPTTAPSEAVLKISGQKDEQRKEMISHGKLQKLKRVKGRHVSRYSQQDAEEYRSGYPKKRDNPSLKKNLLFYTGKISSSPRGGFIDEIHETWFGDYDLLEEHHGYIQWLFPIRVEGLNFSAQPLQLHEAKAIRENTKAQKRVLKSYEMMLDFYGIRLKDPETGEVERSTNSESRFKHLNRSRHNYLRITRILKSLGELGLEYLKAPLVRMLLEEALVRGTLPNAADSALDYWVQTIRDDQARTEVMTWAESCCDIDDYSN